MYSNMITNIDEVTVAKTFESINPFFVFLYSKEGENNVVIMQTKVSFDTEMKDTPLCSQMWNAVALNKIAVTSDVLNDYRIFIGYIG